MTITLYALTNDRARLNVKRVVINNDPVLAETITGIWTGEGYIVTREQED